jgi:UDP-N-acetylglucosamine 2-epimerase
MLKLLSVVGARPQFIKVAPLSKVFNENKVHHDIVHTGQHYDYAMSKAFFDELEIPEPKYNLEIGSGSPGYQIGTMLIKLEEIFLNEKPDFILVYGDTNSTAAAAIAAAKCNIKFGHVEAGVREFNKLIPEETNKLITDILADYYFCPSETGINNLKDMGIVQNVFNVGDVMIDLIFQNMGKITNNLHVLEKYKVEKRKYVFVTCHRATNTDNLDNLKEILSAISEINVPVIFPIHPRTKKVIEKNSMQHFIEASHVTLIEPIGFFDSQTLIHFAKAVITDSGGVTKECYYHKVNGILTDHQTEWIETVNLGWNIQAGPNKCNILRAFENLQLPKEHVCFYGDGSASIKIYNEILKALVG